MGVVLAPALYGALCAVLHVFTGQSAGLFKSSLLGCLNTILHVAAVSKEDIIHSTQDKLGHQASHSSQE